MLGLYDKVSFLLMQVFVSCLGPIDYYTIQSNIFGLIFSVQTTLGARECWL